VSVALRMSDVHKRFGRVQIIRGVSLDITQGERHAIIGPNGAGKSTLFNLISGRLAVSSGRIELADKNITGLSPFEIKRRGLSRSFQVTNIFPRLSVFENVRCSLQWSEGWRYSFWRLADAIPELRRKAELVIDEIGLTGRSSTPAGVLTYAEQRALEIGITIAGDTSVILLDEPMAGMSLVETQHALELIRRISSNRTLLMIEHDMNVVFDLADRISVLVYGKIIATGTPAEIRSNDRVREAYLGTKVADVASS